MSVTYFCSRSLNYSAALYHALVMDEKTKEESLMMAERVGELTNDSISAAPTK